MCIWKFEFYYSRCDLNTINMFQMLLRVRNEYLRRHKHPLEYHLVTHNHNFHLFVQHDALSYRFVVQDSRIGIEVQVCATGFWYKRGRRRRYFPPNRKSSKKKSVSIVNSTLNLPAISTPNSRVRGNIKSGIYDWYGLFLRTFSIRREISSSSSSFVPKPCGLCMVYLDSIYYIFNGLKYMYSLGF